MTNTIFRECGFYDVLVEDCLINGLAIIKTNKYELRFNKTKDDGDVDNNVYLSKLSLRGYKQKLKEEFKAQKEYEQNSSQTRSDYFDERYGEVAKLYFTLAGFMKSSNYNDDYSQEYAYLYNKYLMRTKKKNFSDKVLLYLSWGLFGFGERFRRFFIWMILYIIGFSIAYMFTGINDSSGNTIKYVLSGGYPVPLQTLINDFLQCVHFSIITFSTVGYGNITPFGWSLLVSAIQIISGVALVALFTSVVVKKFIR